MTTNFLEVIKNYYSFLESLSKKNNIRNEHKKGLQRRFNKETGELLTTLYKIETTLPKSLLLKKRTTFRKMLAKYIFSSNFIKRFFEKPSGYPGDYLMFEMIYDQKPLSDGIGYYFDKFTLSHSLAKSVLLRKSKIKTILRGLLNDSKLEILKVTNLGCGSCRELKELLCEDIFSKRVEFTLVDQDQEGLLYAKNSIRHDYKNINLNFIRCGIEYIVGFESKGKNYFLDKQDVIYSIGLVDYFSDSVLIKFLEYCYKHLKIGGKLIVGFCSSRDPIIYSFIQWFSDWYFFSRDAIQVSSLIKSKIGFDNFRIVWESSRNIFFLIVTK